MEPPDIRKMDHWSLTLWFQCHSPRWHRTKRAGLPDDL